MNRQVAIGLGATVAVLATGAGIVVAAWPSADSTPRFAANLNPMPPDPHPEKPAIQATLSSLDIGPSSSAAISLDVPERATKPFSLVGITWSDPKAAPHGIVEVRVRSIATGRWSGWRVLPIDEAGPDGSDGAERPLRGATAPMWVGPSDGVAARIIPYEGAKPTALPAGLRLDLIDPGSPGESGGQGGGEPEPSLSPSVEESAPAPSTSASPLASLSAAPTPTSASPSASTVVTLPRYVSRKQWSADETLVKTTLSVADQVRVVFVQHTGGTNRYSCDDSPAIVRAIQKYQVKSHGFADIGYNFLVDKCGTLFEGRRGGVTRAVVGAHTYGFNARSLGIAVLGNYTTTKPTAAARETIARVTAARLGAYGFDPATTAQLTEGAKDGRYPYGREVPFPRLSGERGAAALFAALPAIRDRAADLVAVPPSTATAKVDAKVDAA